MTTRITPPPPLVVPAKKPIPPSSPASSRRAAFVDFTRKDFFDAGRSDAFRTVPRPKKEGPAAVDLGRLLGQLAGPRTPEDALAQMEVLLRGAPQEKADKGLGTTILYDAADVNSAQDTSATSSRHLVAQAQVDANSELEADALGSMSEEDRAAYLEVKQGCLDPNDPVAALSLQKLLLSGALPGEADLVGDGTLLDHLTALADGSAPLAEGVDRGQLLTDLVQELANPAAVDQGYRGTCAPTAVAIQLAIDHPAEYARVMLGLASPKGAVTMAGGMVFKREADVSFKPDKTGRALTQRILAPTFMEIANGAGNYHDDTGAGDGAWSDTLDRLYEQAFGKPMDESRLTGPKSRAHAMQIVDAQLAAGHDVPVAINYGTGLHKVLITGMEQVDGVAYVKIINPWGREERIPRDNFESRLQDINYDASVPEPAAPNVAANLGWLEVSQAA